MEISQCNFAKIARLHSPLKVRNFMGGNRESKTAGKDAALSHNQNANRLKSKRCKSIEIGCKGLNIVWRRGSLKSITGDYRSKVTPLARGLR